MSERHLVWVPAQGRRILGETPEEAEICDLPSDPLADARLEEVEFLVTPFGSSLAGVMDKMTSLKVVQTISTGVDSIVDTVPEHVVLCSARGSSDTGVSEWSVSAILAGLRNLAYLRDEQVAGRWTKEVATLLADCTVLLLGYGSIAKALEERLTAFGPKIARVARQARPGVDSLEALDRLLPEADVVVVLLPLTTETHHLVDAKFLAAMKDGALLVNPARGAIVDSEALLAELQAGRLRAVLDVTDPEPLPDGHPLYHAPGLLLTPHVAGVTGHGPVNAYRLVTKQIRRFVTGEPLLNVVHDGY